MSMMRGDCKICERINVDIYDDGLCIICKRLENIEKKLDKLEEKEAK